MSEQQGPPNSDDSSSLDRTGATEIKAATDASAAPSETGSSEAATAEASPRPANIVLYEPAKAEREAIDPATGPAETSNIRSKWATRRMSRIAAIAAIAASVGAVSGALATLGVNDLLQSNAPPVAVAATDDTDLLKRAIGQLDAELAALKASADHATRASAAQFSKLGERFQKIEKAQDDSILKIAKIADVQDKIRIAAASAPATPETTGSIAAVTPKGDLKADIKADLKTQPIIDGWVLTSVGRGSAIVANRSGLYEVYPGDPLPGVGRVEAVRYQDGRWVVVTAKGLIVKR